MKKSNKVNVAVIRLRGKIGLKKSVKDTLEMLRLYRKNYCIVIDSTPSNLGMIEKVKDYITWGEIDDETLKLLVETRGERGKDKQGKSIVKKFFRLAPPRKGFERKGIKVQFSVGGALSYRGEKINDLIRRMV